MRRRALGLGLPFIDPDVSYTTPPTPTTAFVDFMHGVGRLKHRPASWTDMFFPETHQLPGS